ncbi:MAG: hypothetical protein GY869_23465, partial [Planctomycetes bacterium]|nr:hypothetical protein [Planctomycetota bacterium]
MKKTIIATLATIIILSVNQATHAQYSGGKGIPEDPCQISTTADWLTLINSPTDWDNHFILTADLDFGGIALTPVAPDTSTSSEFQGTQFTGVFDGNDCVIRHATIDMTGTAGEDYVGLFGFLGSGGKIQNLGVEDIDITGIDYVGGLVGYNRGTITDCYATDALTGNRSVGGLVGCNSGTLTSCYATGAVTGQDHLGGLVGRNYGTLTSCYATDFVSGDSYVGGLVGSNSRSTINSCYATGTVTGDRRVGGLVGDNGDYSTITSSYATGAVTGNENVGGLVGHGYKSMISSCYATGAVTGDRHVGGLMADSSSSTITACFWDIDTSELAGSSGGKGLTTAQMQTMSIFQNAHWQDKGYVMQDGLDYPRLAWQGTPGVPIPPPLPIPLNGAGTENDPYQIETAADFALLSWRISILDKHIILMNDIDLSGVRLYPIGDMGSFTGDFDGNGHVICNTFINQPKSDYVGIFSYLVSGGRLRNLGVEDPCIIGDNYVGGLVGNNNSGTITSCYASGAVTGGDFVGGLVGYNKSGTITSCYASGAVKGVSIVGGLVGDNRSKGTITECYATGSVTGSNLMVGGLVGENMYGVITSCFATGVVTGDIGIGGLVGLNAGTIASCYATGAVSGTGYDTGGLVGNNCDNTFSSYATGSVTGNDVVGGLVGENYNGRITHCYSTGNVWGKSNVGGLCGSAQIDSQHKDTGNFWDIETSQASTSAMGTGKTTSQMKNHTTFTNAGWDFVGEYDNGPSDEWAVPTTDGYMILWWQLLPWPELPVFSGGSGTINDPYLISTTVDLNRIGHNSRLMKSHFKLTNDIDLSGENLFIIACIAQPFEGIFVGNKHKIFNFSYSTTSSLNGVGMFCYLDSTGKIMDLGLVDANIETNGNYAGGLVGYNYGTITSCYATAIVKGVDSVGALVGQNYGTITSCYTAGLVIGDMYICGLLGRNLYGTISSCYASSSVTGDGLVGGLLGNNEHGTITYCYASGIVTGNDYHTGGLLGGNSGTITSCYATGEITCHGIYSGGLVGTNAGMIMSCYATGAVKGDKYVGGLLGSNYRNQVIHCFSTGKPTGSSYIGGLCGTVVSGRGYQDTGNFWNTETSEITYSRMGYGKTTNQMKTPTTFTDTGWDFNNVWFMRDSYPLLRWQNNRPVADAGSDRIIYANIDGHAQITLDGSGSYDPDGDNLTYHWSWTIAGQEFISSGADGKVDMRDFAELAKHWPQNGDLSKLSEFSSSWLS